MGLFVHRKAILGTQDSAKTVQKLCRVVCRAGPWGPFVSLGAGRRKKGPADLYPNN